MSTINKQIGLKIKSMRIEYGLSQIELAERINLSFQQIQKYEKGITSISVTRLKQIADAFGVPVSSFFDHAPESGVVGEGKPAYETGYDVPDTQPLISADERTLLKNFRKIRNEKIRKGLIQQLKGLVELEQESCR